MPKLSILHWNDVYRVGPQKLSKASGTIDVTQFGALLEDLRGQLPVLADGTRDGLTLCSGDIFSPSVESSVTRGSHMVPVMNALAPDVCLTGNHDFDFGYPHLTKLIQDTTFPWILSNIIDESTGKVPEYLHEFRVFEKAGLRVGIIGLVEEEWIATVSSWPPQFKYRDMADTGIELSKRLRDPQGEYRCDLILALTHSRIPNDIELARQIYAFSPAAQGVTPIHDLHGADLLLGGHDHIYYISKGVTKWENYDVNKLVLGSAGDRGDVLVVKSGTDFRELSEVALELTETPPGSVRRFTVSAITGTRHAVQPNYRSSDLLKSIVDTLLSSVSKTMKAPVCTTRSILDVRSQILRTGEAAAANWFADVIRHAYDDALCLKGQGGADGVLICGGTLRGDSTYGPGVVTLGNILEILPFEDAVVVLELDGSVLWEALEASLSKWPAQEGRFPVISGLCVSWDSRRKPGDRVLDVWLESNDQGGEGGSTVPVPNTKEGRKYKIVTRDYLAQGHDGFDALKRGEYLIDDESGEMMSSIVRKYLLGSHFIRKMAKLAGQSDTLDTLLNSDTATAITRARELGGGAGLSEAARKWRRGTAWAIKASKESYQDQLKACRTEHMSPIDPFDGAAARRGEVAQKEISETPDEDLLEINPQIDGRLKDEGRQTDGSG
ncbi:Metallo-dependent phosphatase [Pluteus cervinus]|uniref:Metallo-dependent phosphatase n=1 Tax=Pluteus cervinus TaxID=181527 RepID=A0ACD3APM0_9AGAR|nr:Metallo-dependent phosphatase [Pluteus cervinus]